MEPWIQSSALPLGERSLELGALELRGAPTGPVVSAWRDRSHGHRWFGGYNVPDDCDQRSRDVASLPQTFPRRDFDALVRLARTRAAQPIDSSRVLPAIGAER